jgi:histidinol phosphatase-like enzyme
MKIQQELTQDQLAEFKELAKTKMLKEIAGHFNMSKQTFLMIRKQQQEIDIIYQAALKEKRNKIYTAKEILKIEKMLETSNMENIARYLWISIPALTKARNKQPELEEAIIRGIKNRPNNFNYLRQKESQIKK